MPVKSAHEYSARAHNVPPLTGIHYLLFHLTSRTAFQCCDEYRLTPQVGWNQTINERAATGIVLPCCTIVLLSLKVDYQINK